MEFASVDSQQELGVGNLWSIDTPPKKGKYKKETVCMFDTSIMYAQLFLNYFSFRYVMDKKDMESIRKGYLWIWQGLKYDLWRFFVAQSVKLENLIEMGKGNLDFDLI